MFKCQSVKSLRFSKCLILKAADRKAVRAVAAVHEGTAAEEVQEPGAGTTYRT